MAPERTGTEGTHFEAEFFLAIDNNGIILSFLILFYRKIDKILYQN
jgi:hypothetical protein